MLQTTPGEPGNYVGEGVVEFVHMDVQVLRR